MSEEQEIIRGAIEQIKAIPKERQVIKWRNKVLDRLEEIVNVFF